MYGKKQPDIRISNKISVHESKNDIRERQLVLICIGQR